MDSLKIKELFPNFSSIDKSQGLFISFEGIEGSGKSTQIQNLASHLTELGYETISLREPGGTLFGEKLREAILKSEKPVTPIAEAYLFASARAQLLTEKILPHLQSEKSAVLLDRYLDSSLAYQGMARNLGFEEILRIHHTFPLNILPQRTFYIAIDVETSLQRQNKRGNEKDYFESEKTQFTRKLIEGFDLCHKTFPERFIQIDGKKSISDVSHDIKENLAL